MVLVGYQPSRKTQVSVVAGLLLGTLVEGRRCGTPVHDQPGFPHPPKLSSFLKRQEDAGVLKL